MSGALAQQLKVGLRREEENHAHRREEESSDRKTQFTELYPKMNCHNKTQFDFFLFSLSRSEMVGHSFTKFQSCPCLNNLPPSEHVQSRSESEERHCWAEAVDVASHGNVDRVFLHRRVLRRELLHAMHQELNLMVARLCPQALAYDNPPTMLHWIQKVLKLLIKFDEIL